jgi:hypothetical protein
MAEFRAAWPKNGPVKFLPGREVCGLESGPAPNFLKGIVQPLKRGLMGGINSGTGRIWQPGASGPTEELRGGIHSPPHPTPPPHPWVVVTPHSATHPAASWRGSALVSQLILRQCVCVDQLRWIHSFISYSQCTTTTVYSVASVSDSQSDVTVV